jgi:hypothetical protein
LSLNIHYLAQLKVETSALFLPDRWLHSSDLALGGPLALELDFFTAALKSSGLSLTNASDTLTWVGGDGSGHVTAKNVYAALPPDRVTVSQPSWLPRIWSWQLPLKLKLFLWLGASNKLLTWENLQKKGRHGPGLCVLCREATEDIHHLLLHCRFTQTVWQHILQQLSLSFHWTGASFPECFATWTFDLAAPPSLAVFVCWHIWKERNMSLFENTLPSFGLFVTGVFHLFTGSLPLSSRFFTKWLISLCLLVIQWPFLMEQPK